jgi:glycerol uptake facilitator-like aquaporin
MADNFDNNRPRGIATNITMAPRKNPNPQEDEYSLFTQCVSELMGTFIMVMIGSGAECISLYLDDESSVNVPMLWVVGATLGIYIAISTGHLNPAVTLAFALVRPGAFPMRKVVPYWMAQVGGAMLAGVANFWLFYGVIENYEERHVSPFANSRGMKKSKESECSEYDRANLQSASAFGNFWRYE